MSNSNTHISVSSLSGSKTVRVLITIAVCFAALFCVEYGYKQVTALKISEQISIAVEKATIDSLFETNKDPLKSDPAQGGAYDSLSPFQKQAYEKLYKALWLRYDSVRFNGLTNDELFVIYDQIRYDHPELIDLGYSPSASTTTVNTSISHKVATFFPDYIMDERSALQCRQQLSESVKDIASKIDSDSSDAQKARLAHDALCALSDPGETNLYSTAGHTAYDALCAGKAVCEGYAQAYTLLCREIGLDCQTIIGILPIVDDPTVAHAWNKVQIEEEPLFVDVTLDDGQAISHSRLLLPAEKMEALWYEPFEANVFPSNDE